MQLCGNVIKGDSPSKMTYFRNLNPIYSTAVTLDMLLLWSNQNKRQIAGLKRPCLMVLKIEQNILFCFLS